MRTGGKSLKTHQFEVGPSYVKGGGTSQVHEKYFLHFLKMWGTEQQAERKQWGVCVCVLRSKSDILDKIARARWLIILFMGWGKHGVSGL